jgi:hypothetical protein
VDERGFDNLVRSLAVGASRRSVVRTLIGALAVIGGGAAVRETEAARRGFSGPAVPTLPIDPFPCRPSCNGQTCGSDGCGGTCTCPGGGNCICLTTSGIPNAGAVCAVDEHLYPDAGCKSSEDCQQQYGEPYFCDTSSGTCYLSCLP